MSSDAAIIVNFPHRFWLRTVHVFCRYGNRMFLQFSQITFTHEQIWIPSLTREVWIVRKKIRKPLCKEESPVFLLSWYSHHGRLTRIPRFASFFRIFALVVSSFLRICWNMKALASIDNFFGLPEQNLSKFARELVRRRHLILLV